MPKMKNSSSKVLALYPNPRGIGYALFNSPKELVDFGIGYIRPTCNTKAMKRVKKYLEYYMPDIVIVRDVKGSADRFKRTQKLIANICNESRAQELQVHSYSREQIKEVFSQFNCSTKYEVATTIANWFPELKSFTAPKRKPWEAEHHYTGVFDAISIAIVHYYLE